ncbi:hypothetical protein CARN8_2100002 [mine drainage metagenome]|uniref:Uncharacterized protein n=1 Tax=mine drainage metagenome TaxID=410659 RepID=A0A3P3ZMR9_9ZZZZ
MKPVILRINCFWEAARELGWGWKVRRDGTVFLGGSFSFGLPWVGVGSGRRGGIGGPDFS